MFHALTIIDEKKLDFILTHNFNLYCYCFITNTCFTCKAETIFLSIKNSKLIEIYKKNKLHLLRKSTNIVFFQLYLNNFILKSYLTTSLKPKNVFSFL